MEGVRDDALARIPYTPSWSPLSPPAYASSEIWKYNILIAFRKCSSLYNETVGKIE